MLPSLFSKLNARSVRASMALILVLLTGIGGFRFSTQAGTNISPPNSPDPEENPKFQPQSTATPLETPLQTHALLTDPAVGTLTPTPSPLRFIFPTSELGPVSAWRPPLYPVPWSPTPHDHFFLSRPIGAEEVNWPLANYRYGGVFFEDTVHTGVDIAASMGTPVLAAGPGKVIWADYGLYSGVNSTDDPYGLAVAIRHDFGYDGKTLYTLYGHLSRIDVIRGQHLETGDQIGLVGDTGFTTGPHLHFEIRLDENNFFTTYNPELWMAPPQGWGLLTARIMGTGGQLLFSQPINITSLDSGQKWKVISYGSDIAVNSDPYYKENMVIGDLPAGRYEVEIAYLGRTFRVELSILPGQVTYFTFRGRQGFYMGSPQTDEPLFTPPTP